MNRETEQEDAAMALTAIVPFQYKDGLSHGKGKLVLEGEGEYEGDFIEGQKHGKGQWTGPDDMLYQGQYQHDRRHGLFMSVK